MNWADDRALDVADWCLKLGKSRPTVIRMAKDGEIPLFKSGGDFSKKNHWSTPPGLARAWDDGLWPSIRDAMAREAQPVDPGSLIRRFPLDRSNAA